MYESGFSLFQLCFRCPKDSARSYAFPCDSEGHVDLDGLTERARNNYFFARGMVGRELLPPAVVCAGVSRTAASVLTAASLSAHPWMGEPDGGAFDA